MRFNITPQFSIETDLLRLTLELQPQKEVAQVKSKKGDVTLLLPNNFDFSQPSKQDGYNKVIIEILSNSV